jgi:hypothetical protein
MAVSPSTASRSSPSSPESSTKPSDAGTSCSTPIVERISSPSASRSLWVASRKFDAGRYREFRQFADPVVRRRLVDWLRSDRGRSRWAFGAVRSAHPGRVPRKRGHPRTSGHGSLALDASAGDDGGPGRVPRSANFFRKVLNDPTRAQGIWASYVLSYEREEVGPERTSRRRSNTTS